MAKQEEKTQEATGGEEAKPSRNVVKNKDFKSTGSWFNNFLDEQTSVSDEEAEGGATQIGCVRELAYVNGVEIPESYANLNIGMQRMNIGNRLRAQANKRGGLKGRDGKFVTGEGLPTPTHDQDGNALKAAKQKKTA